jgi:hypothetical protein
MLNSKETLQSVLVSLSITRIFENRTHFSFSFLKQYLGTIIHPKATIFAIAGPIIIGSGCIIEESAIIVNR